MVDISIVTMIGIPTNITGGAPPCLDLFHPFLKFRSLLATLVEVSKLSVCTCSDLRILEDWILVKGINPLR